MNETHVVFGATGALGAAVVRQLAAEGKLVRAVVRDAGWAQQLLPSSAGVVVADATNAKSVRSACEGASVVYHCVNVRYSRWTSLMPAITENLLSGAREAKARLLFPGTVYGYGPLQACPATEDHPLGATSKKGQLRNSLERMLMEADRAGKVRVVIPRFPHLYGPNVTNPLMAPIFESALARKPTTWPMSLDTPHNLIYVEDAARACTLLASSRSAFGQVWHVPGPGPLTGRQFIEMVYRAAQANPDVKALRRYLFRIVGWFIPDAGEMVELLYLFEHPMLLDGSRFARAFPSFSFTPHQEAIASTVEWFRTHPRS